MSTLTETYLTLCYPLQSSSVKMLSWAFHALVIFGSMGFLRPPTRLITTSCLNMRDEFKAETKVGRKIRGLKEIESELDADSLPLHGERGTFYSRSPPQNPRLPRVVQGVRMWLKYV